MAWAEGLVIRGGRYAGASIGISSNLVGGGYAADIGGFNDSAGQQVSDDPNVFYNYDFEKMISCSGIFSLSGADFADECIADIAIIDDGTITGYFSLYATRSGLNVSVTGKVKNASGVVISTFPQGASIIIDGRVETTAYLCLAKGTVNNYTLYGLYFNNNQHWQWAGMDFGLKAFAGAWINDDRLYEFYGLRGHIDKDVKKKSPEFGPASKPGGGYNETSPGKGSFDDHSDLIELTPLPTYNPCDAQFLKVWLMDGTDLAHLSDALFPQYDLSNLDILGTWKEIAEMLLNNKRIDYMLDLLIVPVEPSHATNKQHITCGGWPLSYFGNEETPQIHHVDGKLVQNCYVVVDCQSVSIPEYWANFLDFAGTKVKVFLPYIGYVDLQPEYVIGGELTIKYRFNVYDGSFMCYLFSSSGHSELDGSLIGQYAGVAAIHLPLQSQDYTQKISGLISSLGTVVAGAASGGISAAAAGGATANLTNTLVSKPGSAHANGYNASSSFLSHKRPYLIIERQTSQFSEKYPEEVGLPLNVTFRLGDLTGLTKCETAHLDTIPATVEVKEKISQLLRDGVIL